jgi:hypothetical protein
VLRVLHNLLQKTMIANLTNTSLASHQEEP